MGQQNVIYRTQEEQQEKYSNLSKKQIEKLYIYKHFRVGAKEDKDRWMHSYLMKETLCNDNCEIVEYIWMKINSLLKGDTTKQPLDINVVETEYKVYNINQYITEQAQWDKIEW